MCIIVIKCQVQIQKLLKTMRLYSLIKCNLKNFNRVESTMTEFVSGINLLVQKSDLYVDVEKCVLCLIGEYII